jgi:tetratricopeptide (TPR) repeat protein
LLSAAGCNLNLQRAFIKGYQCRSAEIPDPRTAGDYVVVSRYHFNADEMDCALGAAEEAIKMEPDNARAFAMRAFAHYGAKEYWQALPDFHIAIRLDPNYAESYSGRSDVYRDINELDNAVADITKAIDLAQKDEEFNYLLDGWTNERGNLYFQKGEYERALADFSEAIRLEPDFYLWYKDRAKVYRRAVFCLCR